MRAYIFDGSVAEVVEVLEAFERLKAEISNQSPPTLTESKSIVTKSNTAPKKVSTSVKVPVMKQAGGSIKTKPKSKTRRKPLLLGTEPKENFVSVELIQKVFERRPLTDLMTKLLQKLVSVKEGIWVSTPQLCEMTEFTPRQLQGLMVSLRHRVAHTEGYKEDHHFLDSQLNKETNDYNFRIPAHLRSAVQRAVNG